MKTKSDIIKEECEKFEEKFGEVYATGWSGEKCSCNSAVKAFLIAFGNRMSSATLSAVMVEEKNHHALTAKLDNVVDVAISNQNTGFNHALATIKAKGQEWDGTEVK